MGEQGRMFDDRLNPLDVFDEIYMRIQQVFPGAHEIEQPQLSVSQATKPVFEPPKDVWEDLGYPPKH